MTWDEIATFVPGRTGKQCRERYVHHLAPGLRTVEWTAEEEGVLLAAQTELGNKWASIALRLPGRCVSRAQQLGARVRAPERVCSVGHCGPMCVTVCVSA